MAEYGLNILINPYEVEVNSDDPSQYVASFVLCEKNEDDEWVARSENPQRVAVDSTYQFSVQDLSGGQYDVTALQIWIGKQNTGDGYRLSPFDELAAAQLDAGEERAALSRDDKGTGLRGMKATTGSYPLWETAQFKVENEGSFSFTAVVSGGEFGKTFRVDPEMCVGSACGS